MAPPQYTPICALTQLRHPPPFHPDQLRHAQQGCPDCLDHLMAQNDALVHWVIRRFGTGPLAYDEALQSRRIGLWQALLHLHPARGTAFASYAVPAIARRIRREAQRVQRFWRPVPARAATEPPDPVQRAERQELRQAVRRWVGQLPPRQGRLLRAPPKRAPGPAPERKGAGKAPLAMGRRKKSATAMLLHLSRSNRMEDILHFDIDPDELELFLQDVNSHLQAMESGILSLEPIADPETLNATFKG
jgi:RNA polymerase sigma factor (sigma-70 family)